MTLSTQDRERIAAAIRAAETGTSGEIVCVLARASVDATGLPVLLAAVLALALPWILVAATALPVYTILTLQVGAFVVLLAMLALPRVRVLLMPRRARRAAAHRVALEQFTTRGLANRPEHAGVLIFVSLAERYARIVADDGIAAHVPQAEWQAAVDTLIAHLRAGRVADGFVAAIGLCGEKLARHFPPTTDGSGRLPDRLHVI